MKKTITVSFENINFGGILKKSLPIVLIGLAILAINWGLHKGLAPDEAFDTFIYPYEQDFQDVEVHRWFSQEGTGTWSLSAETLQQNDTESENAQLYVPHWLVKAQPYRIAAQIDLTGGGESAGINFNAQYPQIFTQHHRAVVTHHTGEYELSTGVVTEDTGYKEQVRIPLAALEQPFRLDVLVGEEVYAVQVNGQTLIENRPLVYQDGLVGLAATGAASFDDLNLTEIETSVFDVNLNEIETRPHQIAEPVVGDLIYTSNFAGGTGSNGWVPFSGDWEIVDGYLAQRDPTGFDYGISYESDAFQSYILQVALTHQEGIGAGVLFNMPTPYQTNGAHMVRYAESGNGVFWGYYDALGNFTGQGHAVMPTSAGTTHTLKIVSGEAAFAIFVDNQQVAANVPLMLNSGYIGLITSRSAAAYGMVDVSGLQNDLWAAGDDAPSALNPAPMSGTTPQVGVDSADWGAPLWANANFFEAGFHPEAAKSNWVPINGHWRIKENTLVQTDIGGYDFGIGYSGEIFQNYRYAVPLMHIGGTGAGLLFNMPDPGSLAWASTVRYSDTADMLMWGYYDETGKFKGQGSADVAAPGTERHIISVLSKENTYDVLLDGETVGQDIPLARKRGYIGLVTSRSSARFGPLRVSGSAGTLVSQPDGMTVEMLGNMRIISGDWTQEGDTITQNNPDFNDYVLSTDVSAGVYTLETTITLPADADLDDAGGGLIFHMPDQTSRANAHLVRLSGGGKGVFWGYFDADKAFVGQGSASFEQNENLAAAAGSYAVKIVVQHDSYALLVDGIEIASDIALINSDGYIGLLAYRGPVSFGEINLKVGGSQ